MATLVCVMLAVFLSADMANADCADVNYRCRIPISDVEVTQQTSGKGWEVGGSAGAGVGSTGGKKPEAGASVEVNGKYYETSTSSTTNNAEYIVIGSITVGQCYDALAVACRVEKCGKGTGQERCNQQLDGCKPKPASTSSKTYTVKAGDTCDAIAKANSLALPDLSSLNPGKCGPSLAIGTQLVVGQTTTYGAGVSKCEAKQV